MFYLHKKNLYFIVDVSQRPLRHCFWHGDLVSSSSFYIFSNICFLMKPHFLHFITFSSCDSGYCILSAVSPSGAVLQAIFIVISCHQMSVVNLVCPICILLSLTLYCLQLLYALSHSSMRGLIQCSLLLTNIFLLHLG